MLLFPEYNGVKTEVESHTNCGRGLKVLLAQSQSETPPEPNLQYPPPSSKSHLTRNILIVVVVLMLAALAFSYLGGSFAPTSTTTETETETPLYTYTTTTTYGNTTETVLSVYLFNGTVSVEAGYYDYLAFNVTAGAKNVAVKGNFSASGGMGNDIEVYIMNSTQYYNWANETQTTVFYDSGQVTSSDINISLLPGQSYYLILDNSFSIISSKTVSGEIILTYSI